MTELEKMLKEMGYAKEEIESTLRYARQNGLTERLVKSFTDFGSGNATISANFEASKEEAETVSLDCASRELDRLAVSVFSSFES